MPCIGTVAEAVASERRKHYNDKMFRGSADYFFESAEGEPAGPQAYLIRQAPGFALPLHFHLQHEFQLVLAGAGRLGPHALTPLTLHYASPQAAYGPLIAGDGGMTYMAMRALTDRGAWNMPASRGRMQPGLRKEQIVVRLPTGAQGAVNILLAPRPDGLAAWVVRAHRGEAMHCPDLVGLAGRFHVVASGGFQSGDRTLDLYSCVYVSCDEPALACVATQEDSAMVVLQLPDAAVAAHGAPQ